MKTTKRLIPLCLSLLLALSVFSGCGSKDDGSALSGTVATNGSTSMEKVIGVLSEQFMINKIAYNCNQCFYKESNRYIDHVSGEKICQC